MKKVSNLRAWVHLLENYVASNKDNLNHDVHITCKAVSYMYVKIILFLIYLNASEYSSTCILDSRTDFNPCLCMYRLFKICVVSGIKLINLPLVLLLSSLGGAVAWWLTSRSPDPEVGGSSPTRVAVLCH